MFEAHAVEVGSNEGVAVLLPLFKSNSVGHLHNVLQLEMPRQRQKHEYCICVQYEIIQKFLTAV